MNQPVASRHTATLLTGGKDPSQQRKKLVIGKRICSQSPVTKVGLVVKVGDMDTRTQSQAVQKNSKSSRANGS